MKFIYTVDYPNRTVVAIGRTETGLIYRGKAKCSPSDAFDIKKGKRLARLRATSKQLQFIASVVDKNIEETLKLLEKQNNRMNHLREEIIKNMRQISEETN